MILDSNSDSELFCSLHVPQAATFNKEGLLEEAQKYHKRAYGCVSAVHSHMHGYNLPN